MSTTQPGTAEPVWAGIIPQEDLEVYEGAGFGEKREFGQRPCILIVDVVLSFLGPKPGTPRSADDFMACGDMGWERLPNVIDLVDRGRAAGIPVVFVRGSAMAKRFCGGSVKATMDADIAHRIHSAPFPEGLVPADDEFVVEKAKPSAFFGTPLVSYLHTLGIDTLIVAGTTTSGCVRATVVDGSAHNYEMFVVEDACFDRSFFSHAVNMFEMQQKYAQVISRDEVTTRAKAMAR